MFDYPYSESSRSSIPFLNYDPNNSGNYGFHQPQTITVINTPPMHSPFNNNNISVYQVPSNTSLDQLLRQLGVNVGGLTPATSYKNYYSSTPISFEFEPPRRRHRRRIVCREVSDSESSDNDNYHRRRHYNHHQSPPRDYYEDGDDRHAVQNAWSKMQTSPNNMPPPNVNQNAPTQGQSAIAKIFGQMNSGGNAPQASSSPPPSQGSPPQMQNLWSKMSGAAQGTPPGGQPPQANNMWSMMSGAAQSSPPPPQYPPPGGPRPQANNMWSMMSGAAQSSPPPPQYPPSAFPPYPPPGGSSPAINSVWNRMANAPPASAPSPPMNNPPYAYPGFNTTPPSFMNSPAYAYPAPTGPRPMNPIGNQMSGGAFPPPPPPPLQQQQQFAPQQGAPSAASQSVFSKLFARSPPQ